MRILCLVFLASVHIVYAQKIALKHPNTVYDVAVSKDGQRIAVAGKDSAVYVYSVDGKQIKKIDGFNHSVSDVLFGLGKSEVLAVDYAGYGYTLDWNSSERIDKKLHEKSVLDIFLLHEQELIVTSGRDFEVNIWQKDWELKQNLVGHTNQVRKAIYLSSVGLITVSDDRSLTVWSLNGKQINQVEEAHEKAIWELTIDRNQQIITGDHGGNLCRWDKSLKEQQRWLGHDGPVSGMVCYDEYLITCGFDTYIKVWDKTGQLLNSFKAHDMYCSGIALSSQNKLLVSSGGDGIVNIWKLENLIK